MQKHVELLILRQFLGCSQFQMPSKLNISQLALSLIEKGILQPAEPTIKRLYEIKKQNKIGQINIEEVKAS